jgi:hypothetical protein
MCRSFALCLLTVTSDKFSNMSVVRTIEIFLLLGSVSDPYSFDTDPDPAFRLNTDPDPDPIRIQSFDDQKWENLNIFSSKTTIYLSLGLHKGRLSYRRSLQPSKENIQHFKTWYF